VKSHEYSKLDGLDLAKFVAAGEVTAMEVAQLALSGIEAMNPSLNGVVEIYMDAFEDLENYVPSGEPFCGVPTLIKDCPSKKGRKAEFGSEFTQGFLATQDMAFLKNLEQAGIIPLGRTTTSEHGLAATIETRLYGTTRNPWDVERSTSGSSGGSAAMVAAGVVPFAQGSDGGGSIRNPAACCGLVGLKPSRGRVSGAPFSNAPLNGIATGFMLTRSLRDCAALLDVMSGPIPGDFYEITRPVRLFALEVRPPKKSLKIALVQDAWSGLPVDPQIQKATNDTAAFLENQGHAIDIKTLNFDYNAYLEAQKLIWCAHLYNSLNELGKDLGRTPGLDNLQSTSLAVYERGRTVTADEFLWALGVYESVTRQVGEFMSNYDAMITPTACILPEILGTYDPDVKDASVDVMFDQLAPKESFTALFNATGQPAISLPLYMSQEDLPIGIQIISNFGDEATLFQLATACEQEYQWHKRKPPVHFSRTGPS
jgi:amidase